MLAVAGRHAPGRDEGDERLRRWLGDTITAVSWCRGWKGQKTMSSGGNVDATHTCSGRGRRVGQYYLQIGLDLSLIHI